MKQLENSFDSINSRIGSFAASDAMAVGNGVFAGLDSIGGKYEVTDSSSSSSSSDDGVAGGVYDLSEIGMRSCAASST